jgi:hypothetical protein
MFAVLPFSAKRVDVRKSIKIGRPGYKVIYFANVFSLLFASISLSYMHVSLDDNVCNAKVVV